MRTRRQRSWCPFALRCAHKGPELGNVVRTQGRNQAVVCGVVLRYSVPCVRNRELRAKGASSAIRRIETRKRKRRYQACCPRQGAPSTIRCIEARSCCPGASWAWCQGGRSPVGAAVAPRAGTPSALLRSPSTVKSAHKGPELGNVVRTQGRNQAVVCGVVLRNSVPCVRNRELRAKGASSATRCIEAGP